MPLQVAASDEVSRVRRVGATVLVLGGLLEAGRLLVFSFISPVLPQAVGALIYAVPPICIGMALIVLGLSYFRRNRVALVIAGGLNLVTVVVNHRGIHHRRSCSRSRSLSRCGPHPPEPSQATTSRPPPAESPTHCTAGRTPVNKLEFDPAYSAGVRDLLITNATFARRRHRLLWLIGLAAAGMSLLGAGGAVAANYLLPGQDVVTSLGQTRTLEGRGNQQVSLGHAPSGTNSLEFTISCSGGGELTYPNGAGQTCSDHNDAGVTDNMPWNSSGGTLRIGAPDATSWRLTYHYSHRQPTSLATNTDGQTYGVDSENGHPDLIAAIATNGRQGYINAEEEARASCGDVHSPAEALKCNSDHEGRTIFIPVYDSDGTTKIGVFQIG